jgi:hypothetical protein
MLRPAVLSAALLLTVACDGNAAATDSDMAPPPFCTVAEHDGEMWLDETSAAASGSGSLDLRVITDQSEDVNDPFYVAYRNYTLEPTETGGVQTTGTTSGDGLVQKTLGAGIWTFEATWTRGSTTCLATTEALLIESGQTTHACVVLTCPEG